MKNRITSKLHECVGSCNFFSLKFTRAYLFQIALEIKWLPVQTVSFIEKRREERKSSTSFVQYEKVRTIPPSSVLAVALAISPGLIVTAWIVNV